MKSLSQKLLLGISSVVMLYGIKFCSPGNAQIVPDNTLGAESSSVQFAAGLQQPSSSQTFDLIEGGAIRGSNLFHSFQEFNVSEGQRVYFANPTGVETILSRITGENASNIFGTLGVDGEASLFLLNPNGIVFGENAQLDVAGSFLASAGTRFLWSNGQEFDAINSNDPPLLRINVNQGIQHRVDQQGDIRVEGNLSAGDDLALAARNLNVRGTLQAERNLTLDAQEIITLDGSEVIVESSQAMGGNISINAQGLLLDNGTLSVVTDYDGYNYQSSASILIEGLEFLVLDNNSLISATALDSANGGDIKIAANLVIALYPTGLQGSDVIANSERGVGGRIELIGRLAGLEFQEELTPNNDITVSSQFGIATFTVDPLQGITPLVVEVSDPTQLIDRRCTVSSTAKDNRFVITGRGGLPPAPDDAVSYEVFLEDLGPSHIQEGAAGTSLEEQGSILSEAVSDPIVEPQRWILDEQGRLHLVAAISNTEHVENVAEPDILCTAG